MNPKILITGGAGYIGSHTLVALLSAGYECVVLDNLCNSSAQALDRVEALTGRRVALVRGDVRHPHTLRQLFEEHAFHAVLHFAGLKAVGESVAQPLRYYENNVLGTLQLLQAMTDAKVFTLVFSSSATVYGEPATIPVTEACATGQPANPYGRSKLMAENMLRDLAGSDSRWRIAVLRYFNPVGAHESGHIGEDPTGVPNNLVPYIARVAMGKLPELAVFGNDYPTPDGTGIRDYIHVADLAEGHLRALEALQSGGWPGAHVWNLGTGRGHSVLEVIRAFEAASGRPVKYRISPRRSGDIATCYADASKAERDLQWKATRSLADMMRDVWRWQSMNPEGYRV